LPTGSQVLEVQGFFLSAVGVCSDEHVLRAEDAKFVEDEVVRRVESLDEEGGRAALDVAAGAEGGVWVVGELVVGSGGGVAGGVVCGLEGL